MGRWKEKRKPGCSVAEHKQLQDKIKELQTEHWENAKKYVDGYNKQEEAKRLLQIQLQTQRDKFKDLETALTKTALLLEVQGKQMRCIKEICGFFEPNKPLTANERQMFAEEKPKDGTNSRTS